MIISVLGLAAATFIGSGLAVGIRWVVLTRTKRQAAPDPQIVRQMSTSGKEVMHQAADQYLSDITQMTRR